MNNRKHTTGLFFYNQICTNTPIDPSSLNNAPNEVQKSRTSGPSNQGKGSPYKRPLKDSRSLNTSTHKKTVTSTVPAVPAPVLQFPIDVRNFQSSLQQHPSNAQITSIAQGQALSSFTSSHQNFYQPTEKRAASPSPLFRAVSPVGGAVYHGKNSEEVKVIADSSITLYNSGLSPSQLRNLFG